MEIRWKNDDGYFSMRAAALIIRDGCALLAQSRKHDCYYTIGGGVCQNESSADAILRECREETGCTFEIERLVFVQERFYTAQGLPRQEVAFFYLMKDNGVALESGTGTDQTDEQLCWIPLDRLETVRVVPGFLRTALKNLPAEPVHLVSYE